VEKLELSFEDKYTARDDSSSGAGIATLLLSMIQGFDIDPNVAIGGDVSVDWKVEKIAGIAAELRVAANSGAKIVALPIDNFEQVQDAMLYDGPSDVTDVQVIGIQTLDDAANVARVNRAADLTEAIDLFSQVQASLKTSPDYVFSSEARNRLGKVLALEPNHMSAKLLLEISQGHLPKMSAEAVLYYTALAVNNFWNTPVAPNATVDYSAVAALVTLKKIRPMADLTTRSYVDAWIDYIDLYSRALASEGVTVAELNDRYQAVQTEAQKLNTNRDLAEKLLQEGI
jgi:hypothetical protein